MSNPVKLRGVYPVVPTPLHMDESLDLAGLQHLVRYYLAQGCHGLLVLGSGSESPYFSFDEKCSIVHTAVNSAGHRLPIVVGCTFFSAVELLAFIKEVDAIPFDAYEL